MGLPLVALAIFAFSLFQYSSCQENPADCNVAYPKVPESTLKNLFPTKCGLRPEAPRIVGGTVTVQHEYPWMAYILRNFNSQDTNFPENYCGGSVIADRYVLTARHCLEDDKGVDQVKTMHVIVGAQNIEKALDWNRYGQDEDPANSEMILANRIFRHSCYKRSTLLYDVAIIELSKPITFDYRCQPVCFYKTDYYPPSGWTAFISGWGYTIANDPNSGSKELLKVKLQIRPLSDGLTLNNQCSLLAGGTNNNIDQCSGDSGGPLVIYDNDKRFYQIGVVSNGPCGKTANPNVYVRPTCKQILDFIIYAMTQ